MINHKQTIKGYVLLEIIIYVAIFSILVGGLVATSFLLIQNSGKTNTRVTTEDELNFILKKIDFVLTGASNVNVSADKKSLAITNLHVSANPFKLEFDKTNQKIKLNNANLSTVNVHVTNLSFEEISNSPKVVKVEIVIDGQSVTEVKYLNINI